MGQLTQKMLADGLSTTAAPTPSTPKINTSGSDEARAVDVRDLSAYGVFVKTTGGTTGPTFTVEGTVDPSGEEGWAAMGTRASSAVSYATTALTPGASSAVSYYLDPTDNPSWIRVNVTVNDATGVDAYLVGEQ